MSVNQARPPYAALRVPLLVALLCALIALPRAAAAHALDVSTARVTLRDEHVEVLADVDLVQLVIRTVPDAKDATNLATCGEEALAGWVDQARRALEGATRLEVDGMPIPLVLRAFPAPPEVRMLAAQVSASASRGPGATHVHAPTSPLRFESARPVADARSVTVTLPSALGPVLYTFVQPSMSYGAPGAAASFPVLVPRAIEPQPAAPRAPSRANPAPRTWVAAAAWVFAVVAMLAQLIGRRQAALASTARHDRGRTA